MSLFWHTAATILFILMCVLVQIRFDNRKKKLTPVKPMFVKYKYALPTEHAEVEHECKKPHLELPRYYTDKVVFQRGPGSHIVWGFTNQPHCPVHVVENCYGTNSYTASNFTSTFTYSTFEDIFIWEVLMPPVNLTAGNHCPKCRLLISMGNLSVGLDITFGDVWLLLGQSNMVFELYKDINRVATFKKAKMYNSLHLYRIAPLAQNDHQLNRVINFTMDMGTEKFYHWPNWVNPTDNLTTTSKFSAIGYYFGMLLTDILDEELGIRVPFGIIELAEPGITLELLSAPGSTKVCPDTLTTSLRNDGRHAGHTAGATYNAMLAPLERHAIKGILWYGGENNSLYGTKGNFTCLFKHLVSHCGKVWSQDGQDMSFGIMGLPPIYMRGNKPRNKTSAERLTRWHTTADKGIVPNSDLPNAFYAVTHDFWGPGAYLHQRNKLRFSRRLVYGAANKAYGINKYPLNGPFPMKFTVSTDNVLHVLFDTKFIFKRDTTNSGFYFCCRAISECDVWTNNWSLIPKSDIHVSYKETQNIDIVVPTCAKGKLPSYIGYAFDNLPAKKDGDLPIFSNDKFGLPGNLWRCHVKVNEEGKMKSCEI